MPKRVGVVGFGSIGRHHARNLATIENVDFIGIADPRAEARREAASLGYRTFESLDGLLHGGVDAIVLSIPTELHYELSMRCLESRCAVLVEKPIAHCSELGKQIVAAFREARVPLMVGYVERFNPAVIALRRFIQQETLGRIFSISARRVGLMPARQGDANVLLDIGVHDLDLIAYITGCSLELKSALGGRAVLEDKLDYASLALVAGDIAVDLTANWITPVKIRELFVTGENGCCHVDYVTQTVRFAAAHRFTAELSYEGQVREYVHGQFIDLPVEHKEPLRCELEAFVSGMVDGNLPDPAVSLVSLSIAEEATRLIEAQASSPRENLAV